MNSVSVLGAPASRRPVPSASIINSPARRQRSQGSDYERIEKAIVYLQAHFEEQPELATIARAVNLSEYHFQRLFSRWTGISPKRFLQFLTVEHAKNRLADASSVLDAALDAGLSGPGRLHDLFISTEAVTPGEFKARGAGIQISYGFHSTPFGVCLAGVTSRGLCWLSFLAQGEEGRALRDMKAHWGGAAIAHSRDTSGAVVRQVFSNLGNGTERRLNLLLMGTNFQVKVWQ